MNDEVSSLDLFSTHSGWGYRLHGDIFTYTLDGFATIVEAWQDAMKNERVIEWNKSHKLKVVNKDMIIEIVEVGELPVNMDVLVTIYSLLLVDKI